MEGGRNGGRGKGRRNGMESGMRRMGEDRTISLSSIYSAYWSDNKSIPES